MKHPAKNDCPNRTGLPVEDTMPLAEAPPGSRVRMRGVAAGCALATRLRAMGLYPGVEIEIIRNTGTGPVIVAINGARLMLGRGVMDKVRVS